MIEPAAPEPPATVVADCSTTMDLFGSTVFLDGLSGIQGGADGT